jgi:hypothetical protein
MKVLREIACGSVAATTTASIFSPLECVKTRIQVQADPTANVRKLYTHGFVRALISILKSDGILLTWSHGFVGFVGRDFFYSGLRIGCYPTVRSLYSSSTTDKNNIGLLPKIGAGATTGGCAAALTNPFDVFRVRMTIQGGVIDKETGKLLTGMKKGNLPKYNSSFHCLKETIRIEGWKGLYRGVVATAARAALLSAGQLASYDHSKTFFIKHDIMKEGNTLHMVAAIISGLVGTTVCNPADVLKSRLMIQSGGVGGSNSAGIRALFSVAKLVWVQEGILGFMRGWGPAYARAGPSFFIQMPIVEGLRFFLGLEAL